MFIVSKMTYGKRKNYQRFSAFSYYGQRNKFAYNMRSTHAKVANTEVSIYDPSIYYEKRSSSFIHSHSSISPLSKPTSQYSNLSVHIIGAKCAACSGII